MPQRRTSFLVVLLLIFYGEVLGQESPHFGEKKLSKRNEVIKKIVKMIDAEDYKKTMDNGFVRTIINPSSEFLSGSINYSIAIKGQLLCYAGHIVSYNYSVHVPQEVYRNEIGFFCKKELQLDKITTIPLRFRLGSLNYVNWMEQKPNAVKF